ncbi:hypothetical protein GIB67_042568 [Kingdonia uniflora]|uniref:Uncharacterized protein n=1 Tax=Kingdonia uniflora TaxID=39325 RepID=A0A7J7M153_9MAGN|nr:hypothetical protein GIB67_042568 [Kingdonia uniflora]
MVDNAALIADKMSRFTKATLNYLARGENEHVDSLAYLAGVLGTEESFSAEVKITSLEQSLQDEAVIEKDSIEVERSMLESVLSLNVDSLPLCADEPSSLISFDTTEPPV